ncbi:HNH endonuclease signature motif containing protein [Aeromicrobium sp. NPDC092404]|uniref:HNH endonuclease n=1 Tax=Aeromicrobium sp. NPDC092404 TaxID=3154976 RepID=UPI0034217798
MAGRPKIPDAVRVALFSSAAQRCQNPGCLRPLYLKDVDEPTHIAEIAHIVAFSEDGPRGKSDLSSADRHRAENLILLCPSCHREIDKAPGLFSIEMLRDWKASHSAKLTAAFGVKVCGSRSEARTVIERLQSENRRIFEEFGPHGDEMFDPEAVRAQTWKRRMIDTIIPNSRLILSLVDMNVGLLTDNERVVVSRFRTHVADLVARHEQETKLVGAEMYPIDMDRVLADD